jgi:hypothetical protein
MITLKGVRALSVVVLAFGLNLLPKEAYADGCTAVGDCWQCSWNCSGSICGGSCTYCPEGNYGQNCS